jgi:hypothetical protein
MAAKMEPEEPGARLRAYARELLDYVLREHATAKKAMAKPRWLNPWFGGSNCARLFSHSIKQLDLVWSASYTRRTWRT